MLTSKTPPRTSPQASRSKAALGETEGRGKPSVHHTCLDSASQRGWAQSLLLTRLLLSCLGEAAFSPYVDSTQSHQRSHNLRATLFPHLPSPHPAPARAVFGLAKQEEGNNPLLSSLASHLGERGKNGASMNGHGVPVVLLCSTASSIHGSLYQSLTTVAAAPPTSRCCADPAAGSATSLRTSPAERPPTLTTPHS